MQKHSICRDDAKNIAALYHAYITDSLKYCLWTSIYVRTMTRIINYDLDCIVLIRKRVILTYKDQCIAVLVV